MLTPCTAGEATLMLVSSSPLVGGAASLSLDRDTESSFSLKTTNELLLILSRKQNSL